MHSTLLVFAVGATDTKDIEETDPTGAKTDKCEDDDGAHANNFFQFSKLRF
jgi:hypothetical protein